MLLAKITNHIIIIACCILFTSSILAKESYEEKSFDGLVIKPDSKAAVVYVHPEADFSQYNKIMILEPYVAFKKNWKRDHRRVTGMDMDRIKRKAKELFLTVFEEVLEEGGNEIVTQNGDGVLLVKPAIIDLDVTAPDTMSAGRSRTYATNAGAMTLYVELYDGGTGQILARAADRKGSRNTYGGWRMSGTSVYNSQEARRILKQWATLLSQGLAEARGK